MSTECYWLIRCQSDFVICSDPSQSGYFPRGCPTDFSALDCSPLAVGSWQGLPCYAVDLPAIPEGLEGEPIAVRALFGLAGAEAFALACRAMHLLDWQKNHRFCGRCGTPTERKPSEFAMVCPQCGLFAYPRMSPAVMVLIRRKTARGWELLLARGPNFRPGMWSALAGFVEAGETLEQAAAREVQEEVGLNIQNLRYFQSQSWPFPDSYMLAFFADYAAGELVLDPKEIEAAQWFACDALPPLPNPESIARRLIEAACAEVRAEVSARD